MRSVAFPACPVACVRRGRCTPAATHVLGNLWEPVDSLAALLSRRLPGRTLRGGGAFGQGLLVVFIAAAAAGGLRLCNRQMRLQHAVLTVRARTHVLTIPMTTQSSQAQSSQ
jgi:hypothetical protein